MSYVTSPAEEAEAAQDESGTILKEQRQEQKQSTLCLSRPIAPTKAPRQQSPPQQPQQPPPPPPPPPPCSSAAVDHEAREPEGAAEEMDAQEDIATTNEDGERWCADGPPAGHTFNLAGALVPLVAEEPAEDGTPNFYDWKDVFPELEVLLHGMSEIAAECGEVSAWKAWPEKHYGEGGGHDWKVRVYIGSPPARCCSCCRAIAVVFCVAAVNTPVAVVVIPLRGSWWEDQAQRQYSIYCTCSSQILVSRVKPSSGVCVVLHHCSTSSETPNVCRHTPVRPYRTRI